MQVDDVEGIIAAIFAVFAACYTDPSNRYEKSETIQTHYTGAPLRKLRNVGSEWGINPRLALSCKGKIFLASLSMMGYHSV